MVVDRLIIDVAVSAHEPHPGLEFWDWSFGTCPETAGSVANGVATGEVSVSPTAEVEA